MAGFEVTPAGVEHAGWALQASIERIRDARQTLDVAGTAADAAGDPAAATAYTRMLATWGGVLTRSGNSIARVAEQATTAANTYVQTDQAQMPLRDGA